MNKIILPWIKFSQEGGNKRGHWRKHEDARKAAINTGYYAAQGYKLPDKLISKLHGYEMRVVLKPPTNRYPDWENAGNGLKYYQDGICKALGIDDGLISKGTIERGLPTKGGEIWIFIT